MAKFKLGVTSKEEKQYIRENCETKTVAEIAAFLNRSPTMVAKFLRTEQLAGNKLDAEEIRYNELVAKLHNRPYWTEVERQLEADEGEITYFEHFWVDLMTQFREDVLVTEEAEIKTWIILDILMNRSMRSRKKQITMEKEIEQLIKKEERQPDGIRDNDLISRLSEQLSYIRNGLQAYSSEFDKLSTRVQQTSKTLKATREQRLKRVEDGNKSWVDLIRAFEDESFREKEGREAELVRIAAKKEYERLSQYHQYDDGVVDQPILTADSIIEDEDEDE